MPEPKKKRVSENSTTSASRTSPKQQTLVIPETVPLDLGPESSDDENVDGSKLNPTVIDSEDSEMDNDRVERTTQMSPVFYAKAHSPSLFDSSVECVERISVQDIDTPDVNRPESMAAQCVGKVNEYYCVKKTELSKKKMQRQSTLSQAFEHHRKSSSSKYNGDMMQGMALEEQEQLLIEHAKSESLRIHNKDTVDTLLVESHLNPLVTSTPLVKQAEFKKPSFSVHQQQNEMLALNGSIDPDVQLTVYDQTLDGVYDADGDDSSKDISSVLIVKKSVQLVGDMVRIEG